MCSTHAAILSVLVSIPKRELGFLRPEEEVARLRAKAVSIPKRDLDVLEPRLKPAPRSLYVFQSLRGIWMFWNGVL